MASRTTASSSRIGDHRIAFGIKQYTNKEYGKDEDAIWVWYLSDFCGGKPLAKIVDVTVGDLRMMRSIIDRQIANIEADVASRAPKLPEEE
jgi:hypothetical protein